jgi:twitching motility protein PilT
MENQWHGARTIPVRLQRWLQLAVDSNASDLHLIAGHRPALRLQGDLRELDEPELRGEDTRELLVGLCHPDAIARFEGQKSLDFSFDYSGPSWSSRFRVNLFHCGRDIGACLRVIPHAIPTFEWANFPIALGQRLAFLRDGLVILTGATGSGKSTSLAMIVNLLNQQGGYRIITVEEPVEYEFPKASNSIVTQLEVGRDVHSFADGLKYGLRQDPDVILVGEIRDKDTAQMALSAAETGHLVFSTLHTRDAKGAITRFADLFPQEAQSDIRSQLAMSLRAVVSQRLLPDAHGELQRHLALEVLSNTFPIASAIRTGKIESIDNYIQTGRDDGMIGFDESIRRLYRAQRISRATAEENMREPGSLNR